MRKQNIKEIKNIGTIVASEIKLSDTQIGLYIPIEIEVEAVKAEREKIESWAWRDAKKDNLSVDFENCKLYTETDLYINGWATPDGYGLSYSIGFTSWIEDENGNEVYCEISDPFEITLSDDDKEYIKEMVAMKIAETLFR